MNKSITTQYKQTFTDQCSIFFHYVFSILSHCYVLNYYLIVKLNDAISKGWFSIKRTVGWLEPDLLVKAGSQLPITLSDRVPCHFV